METASASANRLWRNLRSNNFQIRSEKNRSRRTWTRCPRTRTLWRHRERLWRRRFLHWPDVLQTTSWTSSWRLSKLRYKSFSNNNMVRKDKVISKMIFKENKVLISFVIIFQLEIFVNRMKSNSSRGRPIANDSSVQTLFMNTMAMHSKLLGYIQEQEDGRVYFEGLQDKITQVFLKYLNFR